MGKSPSTSTFHGATVPELNSAAVDTIRHGAYHSSAEVHIPWNVLTPSLATVDCVEVEELRDVLYVMLDLI